MPDQPDVPNVDEGTRQPSNRIGTEFHLNEKFVEVVGPAKAQALVDLLTGMVESHSGESIAEVRDRLTGELERIGVQMSDAEVNAFADQIVRSERSVEGAQSQHQGDAHPDR